MTETALAARLRRLGLVALETDPSVPATALPGLLFALKTDLGSDAELDRALAQYGEFYPPAMRAPPGVRCHLPAWLERGRAWGISLQLYELRSRRNWGIGDFADLHEMVELAGTAGADFLGVNPLHALFLADPERASPFSPSNRLFLNPLYIAVDRLPFSDPTRPELDQARVLRATDEVDYAGVAALKLGALRRLWTEWRTSPAASPYAEADFERFREDGGEALRGHALFEAISETMAADGNPSGWRGWPADYADPESGAVTAFARANPERIAFHLWLQWLAHSQLSEVADAARETMRIGLYLDFAVGEAPDGSATWSSRSAYVPGMNIGAPPDMFTASGQDWGLSALSPLALVDSGFAPFRRTNSALMRQAGALRIDHAMGLWQLFLLPEGGAPAEGAYVRYPLQQQLAILAELSGKSRTIVIGEDLGHVPEGFRDVMEEAGILSYRIVYFERDDSGAFKPAADYPRLSIACLSTHDMPTLIGWWRGHDVELRLKHGLIDREAATGQTADRLAERTLLIERLAAQALLPTEATPELLAAAADPASALPPALPAAAHAFVAETSSMLAGVRLADLTGDERQTNLPGTTDSYPNWRLKSRIAVEDLGATETFQAITAILAARRPKT